MNNMVGAMPDPMMMDGVGAMPSGEFINRHTGQKVFVRDCIIQDEDMMLITDQGQITMTEFSRDFIQVSDELYNENGKVIDRVEYDASSIIPTEPNYPAFNTNIYDDVQQNTDIVPDYGYDIQQPTVLPVKEEKTSTSYMISKILDKSIEEYGLPNITIDFDWPEFPKKELNMLINFFDVTVSDISKYIYKNIVNSELVESSINEFVDEEFNMSDKTSNATIIQKHKNTVKS